MWDNPGPFGTLWPDGKTLATRHELGTLDLWRVPSWEEIAAAEAKKKAGSSAP